MLKVVEMEIPTHSQTPRCTGGEIESWLIARHARGPRAPAAIAMAALFSVWFIFEGACEPATPPIPESLKAQFRRPSEIPFPASNPYTSQKAALGKALFFDPRLSATQNMNCASCHNPSFGWQVPLKRAIGASNTVLARNAPTILNHAWGGEHYFWDGRASSLEDQVKGPIESPDEMNMPLTELVKRLASIPGYSKWFRSVFPDEGVSEETIAKALATFERTVVTGFAPFDAWINGDEAAISQSAKRGFVLFTGKANCAACHVGWNFTDNLFHDTGMPGDDIGRGRIEPTNSMAMHAFKTSTLRDITKRAPYMHDGSLPTLRAVVSHYVTGGVTRPSLSPEFRRADLEPAEIDDVLELLETLTGTKQVVALPVLPN
jgi:cytochrome c peroxidase